MNTIVLSPRQNLALRVIAAVIFTAMFQYVVAARNGNREWQWIFAYGLIFVFFTMWSSTPQEFFLGQGKQAFDFLRYAMSKASMQSEKSAALLDRPVSFWILMPSIVITWIFAKSIRNASSLAGSFGIVGGVAYAAWYVSFFTAGIVIFNFRTGKYQFKSLAEAIEQCYGSPATLSFMAAITYRLFNEVWSNSIVVGSFYGEYHSPSWWAAVILSTAIPAVYVFIGGMRSSLTSDAIQAFLAAVLLFIVLGYSSHYIDGGFTSLFTLGSDWSIQGGLDLFFVALLQALTSYPFHDPVLTDRAFLSTPKTMLWSFMVGGVVAAGAIVLFSTLGVYGKSIGIGGEPALVSKAISSSLFTIVNIIFLTSSISTLDSTFASTAKIVGLEMSGFIPSLNPTGNIGPLKPTDSGLDHRHLWIGRIAILVMAVCGTLPLLAESDALDATLISGTTVMGLGTPVLFILMWRDRFKKARLAFHLNFWCGVVLGIMYQWEICVSRDENGDCIEKASYMKDKWMTIGNGSYNILLGVNVYGYLICLSGFVLGFIIDQLILDGKKGPQSIIEKELVEVEPSAPSLEA